MFEVVLSLFQTFCATYISLANLLFMLYYFYFNKKLNATGIICGFDECVRILKKTSDGFTKF